MQFREIPENPEELGERAETAIQASHIIGPATEFIARNVHHSGMLKAGEKWTVTMAISCGFHAEVEIRVFHSGKCEGNEDEGNRSTESSVMFGVRSDGVKLPFPSNRLLKPHHVHTTPEVH